MPEFRDDDTDDESDDFIKEMAWKDSLKYTVENSPQMQFIMENPKKYANVL